MSENRASRFPVKWLITIVDRGRGESVVNVLNQAHKSIHMISLGKGTASSEIMDYLGLDEPEKDIVMSLIPLPLEQQLLQALSENMALSAPGKGIAFTLSLDSISTAVSHHADPENNIPTTTQKEAHPDMPENKPFALIAAVIPHGESDLVVDAARAAGARGGTMVRARALNTEEASHFFHITIQPEKEVVFTIVPLSIKKAVMQSICNRILEKSGEHGIVFSIPIDEAIGLRMPQPPAEPDI
ncbi:MAG: hypothetical protein PHE47_01835 [Oscillospiraceae bacterium]|nr:hypothetical protein [Oscillospiraceae bacterium]